MKRLSYLKSGLTVITALATITLTFLPSIAENPRNSNNRFDRDYSPSISEPVSEPISTPGVKPQNPSSEELGKQLVQELSQCMRNAIPSSEPESLAALQMASMQCTVRVIILTPDGKVRTDASERMNAILTAMNVTLPATVSQGQASVKLEIIPDSMVYTVPVVVGGKAQRFLLDTGASNSILSEPIVKQLGLTGTTLPSDILAYFVVGDDCSNINATLHSLPEIKVDAATVEGMNGMGLPKTAIPGDLAGVLGLDFLKSFDVLINPKDSTLQLLPRSNVVAGGVPLKGKMGVMTTEVFVNGKGPYTFLLDTGADLMVLSNRLANTLSIDVEKAENTEVKGFCGNEIGKKVSLSSVKLQNYESSNLDGVVLNNELLDLLGVDGIVGQNYLNQYQQHWRFGEPNSLGFPEAGSLTLKPL
ncbi:retropepsin-like aspartic protease [Limnoraphis robusta]|uniref:Retropepsin-like aspartic protease n=1 Tax=Limnoraphis robusta CCNP1315 TaxID=3110306 RepID=A0ABU5U049_9CYAN|nr:retropepsin-like aspartic protease [Limnoraphis robusta]MEA5519508.1 retropepsin-like aspartic protease [Limnoraphis robusta CCNP1315]MEA5549316.1 retropepsin-like aspartic protease [Limnoraphis robusta CCNP1324]